MLGNIRPKPDSLRGRVAVTLLAMLPLLAAPLSSAAAQKLPFSSGEELHFRMRVGGFGTIGTGKMTVSGPERVRGTSVLLLTSEIRGKIAALGGNSRTQSWLDASTMSILRFEALERTPLSRRDESFDIYPAERRWVSDSGNAGRTLTNSPLDELSFVYFLRTLPLLPGDAYQFDRHFQQGRNPVTVRVLGRQAITVGAGTFDAVLVEMRVRDPERYRGEGFIRIYFTDDGCRLPLRIESNVPGIGGTVLTLESHTHPAQHFTRRGAE
ncbi:MAG: DUF3108 domain-containing protein [Dehalococcoidia bacterium]